MKTAAAIVGSIVISGVVAYGVTRASWSGEKAATAEDSAGRAALELRLEGLERKLDALAQQAAQPAVAAAPSKISDADLEAAVARVLTAKGLGSGKGAAGAADAGTLSGASTDGKVTKAAGKLTKSEFADAMAKILEAAAKGDWKRDLWAQIRDAGMIDEALAAIEASAKEQPGNADLQYALGQGFIEKLQGVQDGPARGEWAIKADKAFDTALASSPQHWGARFSKATSLAFWPPIFGKQNEAIKQFETLVTQQESTGGTNPEYAQTYYFLGNMYQQQGNTAKAQEVWGKGLKLFPENAQLKSQLGGK
ncbi:MAG: tetratricopeptide repeat protein [Planctomycetes bacterium]|nr:tetratricopeptide repeat protein [Planctomycetota bacterium]